MIVTELQPKTATEPSAKRPLGKLQTPIIFYASVFVIVTGVTGLLVFRIPADVSNWAIAVVSLLVIVTILTAVNQLAFYFLKRKLSKKAAPIVPAPPRAI